MYNNTPLISVIIPCYNVERFIDTCFHCLSEQTLKDFEIIAIDDGSTDGTLKKLKKYESQYCKIVHTINRGVSEARNEGIRRCGGEFLFFMDPDDMADETLLEYAYRKAIETRADAVQFSYRSINENPDSVGWEHNGKGKKANYKGEQIVKELLPRYIGFSNEDLRNYGG